MDQQQKENRKKILSVELDKLEKEATSEFNRLNDLAKKLAIERDACYLHFRSKLSVLREEIESLNHD